MPADIAILSANFAVSQVRIRRRYFKAQESLAYRSAWFSSTESGSDLRSSLTKKRIFSKYPPTDIYQYIDRVACAKNGDFDNTNGIEAHAWFVWNKHEMIDNYETKFHRILWLQILC